MAHVVANLFPYAPVLVQTQKYPRESPKAGQAYLWITVDEVAIKRHGVSTDTPVRYPVGVAVDAEGNVFVSESTAHRGGGNASSPDSMEPKAFTISATSIMDLANTNAPPPAPKPPTLVEATQTSLVVKWKKSTDTTADRYEIQYRHADSPNNLWAALAAINSVKNVALSGVECHMCFEFRVRAHNPAGWGEYSAASSVYWTLPGKPGIPQPPVAGTVANTYASIFWSPVAHHGAPPVVFFLEVREQLEGPSTGGQTTSFRQIYEGTGTGYVATDLKPRTNYVFRLQASNVIGSTPFVESRAIKTMSYAKPEIVELANSEQSTVYSDRWVQCWDPKTEQVFFFNKYTAQRATSEPPEVAAAREKMGLKGVEETPDMLFRRKRFRFHRELRQGMAHSNSGGLSSSLPIELRRESMFEDTVNAFARLNKQELLKKPKITFTNEPGIDSGGLTKDWFLQVSKLATDKSRRLFKPCDQGLYEISPASAYDAKRLQIYKFLGKFLGKAIFDRQTLDFPICEAFYKQLLKMPLTMDDLRKIDAQFHKSLTWMLENSVMDVIDETFSVEVENASSNSKPSTTIVDLKEDGRDIPVTDANKEEYVELMVQWRTAFGVQPQLDAFFSGISTLIPLEALKPFELEELKMLVNGKPTIDVEELRANTVFQGGYNEHSQVVLWLWQALREFPLDVRGLFLKFMTGTNKIPLDGFEPPLNITKSDLDPLALPRTHTCFNQLVMPEYTSYEILVEKIHFAITNADGFELS